MAVDVGNGTNVSVAAIVASGEASCNAEVADGCCKARAVCVNATTTATCWSKVFSDPQARMNPDRSKTLIKVFVYLEFMRY